MDSIDPCLMDSGRPPSVSSACNSDSTYTRQTTTNPPSITTNNRSLDHPPFSPSLTIKIPSPRRLQDVHHPNTGAGEAAAAAAAAAEGYTTPTSSDRRIPAVPVRCPPAPRKPKPHSTFKRARTGRRIILLDISNQINDFLFPPVNKERATTTTTAAAAAADHGNNVINKIRTD